MQLFVARARAVDMSFAIDADNAATIAAICRRLDGLPLAIELAAASIWLLSPEELLARLDPALPLLTGGPDDAPERLRTMRQAIAWSYDLLTADEQALFRQLSIFVGGFTIAGAQGIQGDADLTTLGLVTSLVEKSLLRQRRTASETRFEMLETIREFGLEQLTESGESEATARRHARWCVALAEGVRRTGGLSQGRALAVLEAEHPNLRAALGLAPGARRDDGRPASGRRAGRILAPPRPFVRGSGVAGTGAGGRRRPADGITRGCSCRAEHVAVGAGRVHTGRAAAG